MVTPDSLDIARQVDGDGSPFGPVVDFENHIFDSLADAILIVNADTTISRANPAALKLTGFAENELVGRQVDQLTANKRLVKRFFERVTSAKDLSGRFEI